MIYGIFGHHTGGTSAVAGVLAIHGLQFWGEPRTLDDTELYDADCYDPIFKQRKGDWFFKHPLMLDSALDLINRHKVKPIYVYRDPVAIHMNSGKTPTREKIVQSAIYYTQMSELPEGLYVSYEKLQTETERVASDIAEYIGKEYNPEALEWIDNSKKYRKIADFLKTE